MRADPCLFYDGRAAQQGGRIVRALAAMPFASGDGRLVERFGISRMIVTRQPPTT